MAKSNNESIIEYKGKFENLTIKVNGVTVYSNKLKKPAKTAALQKDQDELTMVSKFASCINHVPELSGIWRQARIRRRRTFGENKKIYSQKAKFGRPAAYNKIVSSNRMEISLKGRPNIENCILPVSNSFPYYYKANFNKDCIDIELSITDKGSDGIQHRSLIIPVGIFSFFDSRKAGKPKFEMLAKYYEIEEFISADKYKIHFPLSAGEVKTIKNYKSCIFYFAIIEHARKLKRVRWFRHNKGLEFSIEGFPKKSVKFGTGNKT